MTVVVGVRSRRGVLLAGDRQSSTTYSNRKVRDSKVVRISPVVAVAACGSPRLGNLLTYHFDSLDDPPLGRDEHRWAVRDFIPYLRDVALAHGSLRIRQEVEYLVESAFLLAVRDRLFTVDEDLQVAEHDLPYDALGSGEDVAIGALRSALGDDVAPPRSTAERLERVAADAIEAATEFTNYVGGGVSSLWTVAYTDDEKAIARGVLRQR